MHIFQIIASNPEYNRILVAGMKSAIETRGGVTRVHFVEGDRFDEIEVAEDADCILSVGGDGTLIAVAQQTVDSGVPLLGINRGHLGYLCDLDEDTVYDAIPSLLENEPDIERRMMLEGYIVRGDGSRSETIRALNDIVVSSLNGLQVIHLSVYVGDEFLYSFNGDGMIFATPTGSTAYNLSANGPIVDPKTDVILMTPINPHTLNSRSIVIDRRDEVALELMARRGAGHESVAVSFDGGRSLVIRAGERVVVHRAAEKVQMIRLSKMSFLERIRSKMVSE